MTHLDEGLLRALIDGEVVAEGAHAARSHLDRCASCRGRLEEVRAASAVVGAALVRLDTAAVPTGAKAAVLARLNAAPDISPPVSEATRGAAGTLSERFALARAAIIVLLFGGVIATALPASPVRGWLSSGWSRATAIFTGTSPDEGADGVDEPTPAVAEAESAGVRLEVGGGELVVLLDDIVSGTRLDVRFVDGLRAAAFAAQPARFRTAEGRIEIIGGAGIVRIQIPRGVAVASIHVNGRMYMTKSGDTVELAVPVDARSADEIRLRVQ